MGAMKNGRGNKAGRDYSKIARQYAEQIVAGKIPACQWVKLACQRQLDDLARKDWEWKWDREKANRVCAFIELLPHIKGRWKTRNIVLEPWQCFHLTAIFGWVGSDGFRRFRKALVVVPRKNAKTTEAAGVGLYMLALDGEPGAEVYSAATTRDQAKISWDMAKRMVERSPLFQEAYGVEALAHSITVEGTASFFQPLARDADSLEGKNVHGGIIDELHAHKTREVFDVLDDATGSRAQPLLFIISTEGDNAAGIFAEQVSYCQQVLQGNHQDDSYFGVVYTIDKEDDPYAPSSWAKANPNLGVSILAKDLEVRAKQAQKNPASQSSFLTKRLNVRVGAGDAYFNMLAWRTVCQDKSLKIEDFYGQRCFIALDLASKIDTASKCYLFPKGGTFYVFGHYYLPEDAAERGNPNYDLYRGWAEDGHLTLTQGPMIDYDYLERDLIEDVRNRFSVERICLDPANSWQFNARMQKELGLDRIQDVPQTWPKMSHPMKELAALIVAGKVKHNGDPVMSWMVGNCVGKTDAKEMVFPTKARANNMIDWVIAALMALGTEMSLQPTQSAYDLVPIAI